MIKTLLMAMTCLTSMVICAQNDDLFGFSKGNVTLSGGVRLSSATSEFESLQSEIPSMTKSSGFQFEPAVSYFLSNHIAIGARLSTGRDRNEQEDRFKNTEDNLRYGIFGSYYFTPDRRFSLLMNLGANIVDNKQESLRINGDSNGDRSLSTTKGFDIGLSAGINYFISSRFALHATLGVVSYTTTESKDDDENTSKQNTFLINTELRNITFGLLYRI